MKISKLILLACTAVGLAACSTYRGGTGDEYSTGSSVGESHPEPVGSPTFRPGMNPEDPRDSQFLNRPEASQSSPPMGQ